MALCVKKQKYRHSPKHVKNIANTSISKCCTYEYFSSPPDDSTNMQIYINRLNLVSKPLIERRHSYSQYKTYGILTTDYYRLLIYHQEHGSSVIFERRY